MVGFASCVGCFSVSHGSCLRGGSVQPGVHSCVLGAVYIGVGRFGLGLFGYPLFRFSGIVVFVRHPCRFIPYGFLMVCFVSGGHSHSHRFDGSLWSLSPVGQSALPSRGRGVLLSFPRRIQSLQSEAYLQGDCPLRLRPAPLQASDLFLGNYLLLFAISGTSSEPSTRPWGMFNLFVPLPSGLVAGIWLDLVSLRLPPPKKASRVLPIGVRQFPYPYKR